MVSLPGFPNGPLAPDLLTETLSRLFCCRFNGLKNLRINLKILRVL